MKRFAICALFAVVHMAGAVDDEPAPKGYWSVRDARAILDRTGTIRLAPSLDGLSAPERDAVTHLLAAGAIVQRVYESSLHAQALAAHAQLERLDAERGHPESTRALLDLYRLFQGPIARTLANERVPFLPVTPEDPGRNVYPDEITKDEADAWLSAHPQDRAALLGDRTVVRRATADNLHADLGAMSRQPVLDALHPGLHAKLEALLATPDPHTLYALPYSVAYADELAYIRDQLQQAAAAIAPADADFAQYLRLRARDLQADDYEGGDAAWVRGRFGALNAQIGSYETYDDKLYAAKTFFAMSVLLRNKERSDKLAGATAGLQRLQDALPYEGHKRVSEDIPIGVYDVVADFGQARSTNTATILPNDPEHVRKYGRTILIRRNIIEDPTIFADVQATFTAAVAPGQGDDLTPDGNLLRILWHEIGHYLGPDHAADGRTVSEAMAEHSDLVEEMKADLVSLWSAQAQREAGSIDDATLRSIYGAGIRRVLQRVQPQRDQPYETMQLMQMNYFLEHGLLVWRNGVLHIDYAAYPAVVTKMLSEVLKIQAAGDHDAATAFIDRYASWDDKLHGAVAKRIEAASKIRYRIVRYGALGE